MKRLFILSAPDDTAFRDALVTHLQSLCNTGLVAVWHDGKVAPGDDWHAAVENQLRQADIVVLLVSASFLASPFAHESEMRQLLGRNSDEDVPVMPVVVRACDWANSPIGHLQMLPRSGKPVAKWSHSDDAWTEVVSAVRSAALSRADQSHTHHITTQVSHQEVEPASQPLGSLAGGDSTHREKSAVVPATRPHAVGGLGCWIVPATGGLTCATMLVQPWWLALVVGLVGVALIGLLSWRLANATARSASISAGRGMRLVPLLLTAVPLISAISWRGCDAGINSHTRPPDTETLASPAVPGSDSVATDGHTRPSGLPTARNVNTAQPDLPDASSNREDERAAQIATRWSSLLGEHFNLSYMDSVHGLRDMTLNVAKRGKLYWKSTDGSKSCDGAWKDSRVLISCNIGKAVGSQIYNPFLVGVLEENGCELAGRAWEVSDKNGSFRDVVDWRMQTSTCEVKNPTHARKEVGTLAVSIANDICGEHRDIRGCEKPFVEVVIRCSPALKGFGERWAGLVNAQIDHPGWDGSIGIAIRGTRFDRAEPNGQSWAYDEVSCKGDVCYFELTKESPITVSTVSITAWSRSYNVLGVFSNHRECGPDGVKY